MTGESLVVEFRNLFHVCQGSDITTEESDLLRGIQNIGKYSLLSQVGIPGAQSSTSVVFCVCKWLHYHKCMYVRTYVHQKVG